MNDVPQLEQQSKTGEGSIRRFELGENDIAAFIAIWANEFEELISEQRARLEARLLLEFFWALAQPLPGESCYDEKLIEL